MNLEEMMEKACHNYCLYCDMLEDEEDQLYLFYEFLKILYKEQNDIKEIPPEILAETLTKLTFE